MLFVGNKRYDINVGRQAVVGQGHAKFILKIRKNPQPTDNHFCPCFMAEVDCQAAIAHHMDFFHA